MLLAYTNMSIHYHLVEPHCSIHDLKIIIKKNWKSAKSNISEMQNCDNYEHFVTGNPHFSRMLSYNTSSNSLGIACQDKNIAAQILLFVVIFSLILNLCSLVPRYILQFASRKLKSKNKKTQNLVEYYNTCSVT